MDQSYITGSSAAYHGPMEGPEDTPIMKVLKSLLIRGAPASLKISVVSVPFQIRDESIIIAKGLPRVVEAN